MHIDRRKLIASLSASVIGIAANMEVRKLPLLSESSRIVTIEELEGIYEEGLPRISDEFLHSVAPMIGSGKRWECGIPQFNMFRAAYPRNYYHSMHDGKAQIEIPANFRFEYVAAWWCIPRENVDLIIYCFIPGSSGSCGSGEAFRGDGRCYVTRETSSQEIESVIVSSYARLRELMDQYEIAAIG